MISFRFHLVSLVAVFLALGLGVLAGTTVLNKGIVSVLEAQTNELRETSASLRQRVDRLEGEARMWSAFGNQAMEHLVAGALPGGAERCTIPSLLSCTFRSGGAVVAGRPGEAPMVKLRLRRDAAG